MSKVTFLTPTFNRASYLPRLYESLCAQTNHAFQWLIIDDGSTDETELVVAQLKEKHILPFEITYRKKENVLQLLIFLELIYSFHNKKSVHVYVLRFLRLYSIAADQLSRVLDRAFLGMIHIALDNHN